MRQIGALVIALLSFGAPVAEAQTLNPSASERSRLLNEYVVQIRSAIRRNWTLPADLPSGATCRVRIYQSKDGVVEDLKILDCTSKVFEDSVTKAIMGASPLPKPKDPALFQSDIVMDFRHPF